MEALCQQAAPEAALLLQSDLIDHTVQIHGAATRGMVNGGIKPLLHPIVQATADALSGATDRLTSDDLARRRRPDRWSVAEILDHLLKTYASTAYILNRCVEKGTPKGRRATLRERLTSWIVLGLERFPTGVLTPEVAVPSPHPRSTVRGDALTALALFDVAATAAQQRFGARTKLANHPVLGPFDADQWRKFHLVHTRHHMKQITRLLRAGAGALRD